MIRVSSIEFGKEVGRYQDMALGQPVVVTHNGRDRTVMIAADEYQRLERRYRQVFAVGDLPSDVFLRPRLSRKLSNRRPRSGSIWVSTPNARRSC
jgi:hypothetical protein